MIDPIKLATFSDSGAEIVLGTSRLSIRLSGADTAGAFALLEFHTPPGGGSARHTHSHEAETFYIHAGSMRFQLGAEVVEATVGSVVHIPPGLAHSFQNAGDSVCTAVILATPAGLEHYFRELDRLLNAAAEVDPATISVLNKRYGLDFG